MSGVAIYIVALRVVMTSTADLYGIKKLSGSQKIQTKITNTTSAVNTEQLAKELEYHHDKSFCKYLLQGFTHGFDTGLTRVPELSYECSNLLSAKTQPATSQLLETELERGYIIGPFANIPYKNYRIKPLGIAKSKYSKKRG